MRYSNINHDISAEPLVKFEYEYRIQKLGDKYRTFRRTSDNAWKSNWGDLKYEEFPIKEYQKKWVDECAKVRNRHVVKTSFIDHCADVRWPRHVRDRCTPHR